MRLMVSDNRALVPLLFPLVSFGGMVQLYGLWALSRVFTTAIPEPTFLRLFVASLIYPAFVFAFLRIDGEKLAFQASTIAFLSAVFGLVLFPVLTVLLAMVVPGFSSANPWFNLVVLVLDLAAAVFFLFNLSETDFHKLPKNLIVGSLLTFEFTSVIAILYGTGTLHQWYGIVATKIHSLLS